MSFQFFIYKIVTQTCLGHWNDFFVSRLPRCLETHRSFQRDLPCGMEIYGWRNTSLKLPQVCRTSYTLPLIQVKVCIGTKPVFLFKVFQESFPHQVGCVQNHIPVACNILFIMRSSIQLLTFNSQLQLHRTL